MFDHDDGSTLDKILNYIASLLDTPDDVNTSNGQSTLDIIKYQTPSGFKESVLNSNMLTTKTKTSNDEYSGGNSNNGNKSRMMMRHEIQLELHATKGYITAYINGYNQVIHLFYHCNIITGLFRMWKLQQDKIVRWLDAGEKQIYADSWLENIVCLWLFHNDNHYMFQWIVNKHQTSDIGVFKGLDRNENQQLEHNTHGIYHIYFAKLTYCLLPMDSNKVVDVCIRQPSYYMNCHHKVLSFRSGIYYLMKHIDSSLNSNMECDIVIFNDCAIQNNQYHGVCRKWVNLEGQEREQWLDVNYTSDDMFKHKLSSTITYVEGKKHGLEIEYNKHGSVTNLCTWHNDQKHGWDIHYEYKNNGNDEEIGEKKDEEDSGHDKSCGNVSIYRQLYYFDEYIPNHQPLVYLGLYVLRHDGHVVCHDNKVNSFLSTFDRTPPEIMEHILTILCNCNHVRINKFFTQAGINLCHEIML